MLPEKTLAPVSISQSTDINEVKLKNKRSGEIFSGPS